MAPLPQSAIASARSWLTLSARNLVTKTNVRRQTNLDGIIPTHYQDMDSGPAPGAVIGIVLGSVAGFLLIVWLISSLTGSTFSSNISGEEEIVVRKQPRSRRSRRSRSTREMREVDIERSPRRERVIVEERRSGAPYRSRSRSIIVEERRERRVPGDDIVEVFEETSDFSAPIDNRRRRGSGGYSRR